MTRRLKFSVFLLATLFGALIAAANAQVPDTSNGSVLRDGQGNPVRTSEGGCIEFPGEEVTDPQCLPEKQPQRIRIATQGVKKNAYLTDVEQQPPKPTDDISVVSKSVHFATQTPFAVNSAGLTNTMRQNALEFLILLEPYFKVTAVEITGHSDASGSVHYNQWLSEKRAESMRIYFRSLGVDPRMMTIRGAGESNLLPDLPPDAAAQRRVSVTAHVQIKQVQIKKP